MLNNTNINFKGSGGKQKITFANILYRRSSLIFIWLFFLLLTMPPDQAKLKVSEGLKAKLIILLVPNFTEDDIPALSPWQVKQFWSNYMHRVSSIYYTLFSTAQQVMQGNLFQCAYDEQWLTPSKQTNVCNPLMKAKGLLTSRPTGNWKFHCKYRYNRNKLIFLTNIFN